MMAGAVLRGGELDFRVVENKAPVLVYQAPRLNASGRPEAVLV
jgi:hypothetical protein